MNKINGYTEDEAKRLVEYIDEGKRQGKSLTELFERYAEMTHRAKGSVRNYYYALLKSADNEKVRDILGGTNLKAETIVPFSEEETDRLIRGILRQTAAGISVRRAVLNLANGDDRLMLRYQNKYRNVLLKEPERIKRLSGKVNDDDFVKRELKSSIDNLYDSLQKSLKEENRRLTLMVKKLSDENAVLRLRVKNG